MSKTKSSLVTSNRNKMLVLSRQSNETPEQGIAEAAVSPMVNAAAVVDSFQRNIMGDDVNMTALVEALQDSAKKSNSGDLSTLEAMLVGQATALQSIFTSLAKRAVHQDMIAHYEMFLRLALKAQSQSRATISALVDLKYPRQATFVTQANIANGPQLINNGGGGVAPRTKESQSSRNELLEEIANGSAHLDTGTKETAGRSGQAMDAMGAVNRA
ncbi:MAG: hypothetical protein H7293_09775 [Candidatus Saccharibacteria bacterium]|nr:hypothetical protein [Rhodoferax sp.]